MAAPLIGSTETRASLRGSAVALTRRYDAALLDLDGVVYVGRDAVPGVPDALATARVDGMRLVFVTNNAARTPRTVADHLTALGVSAEPEDVVTSAQAAARYLAERLPHKARVLVIGAAGLVDAVVARGLTPVETACEAPVAVVQGFSPDLAWSDLAEGTVAIRAGAMWVATNGDATVPSERGPLPGNGATVAALRFATGCSPVVVGKPHPTMHRESAARSSSRDPVVVGDRLDTDIEGANRAGCDSMLVLSGITDAAQLLAAPPTQRPTFIARDASGLLDTHRRPRAVPSGAICGRWSARRDQMRIWLGRTDRPGADGGLHDLDALRALCRAQWDPGSSITRVDPLDDHAERVLCELGLSDCA